MKRYILFILSLLFVQQSFGQITITSDQFLQGYTSGQTSGRSYSSNDLNGLPALIATAGANQSWDFGGRTYVEDTTSTGTGVFEIFAFPGSVPLANDPDFATSTHVVKIKDSASSVMTYYQLVRFTSEGFWSVGLVFDSAGTATKMLAYVPPLQQMAFPLTYLTEWHSTSQIKAVYVPDGFTATEQVDAKVDGYGTLIVPTRAGKQNHDPSSSAQTLRMETKNTQTLGTEFFSFSSVTYSYQWITLSGYGAYISADTNKVPLSVSYSTPGGSGSVYDMLGANAMEIHIGANPVYSKTEVSFMLEKPEFVRVGIVDALGNDVKLVMAGLGQSGKNLLPLDLNTFSNGTYFLRIDAGSQKAIRKLVVTH